MGEKPEPVSAALREAEKLLAEIVALKDRTDLAPGKPESECQMGWWLAVGYAGRSAELALRSVRLAIRHAEHRKPNP